MNRLYVVVVLLTLLASCSDKEKKAKALKDLDATQQTLVTVNNEISNHEKQLSEYLGELEVAKDRLGRVKEYQLMRTAAEREQQIREANDYILSVETSITNIKSNIEYYQDSARRTEIRVVSLQEFLKN